MEKNNAPKKIVTLGEIMLRLSPPDYQRIASTENFDVCYGGGEANVAVSLSNYGMEASFISKMPKNFIGDAAIKSLLAYGVNTEHIVRGGDRLGIYFLEIGASIRSSKVVYDRAHSAISEAKMSEFDFEKTFEGKDWFHVSGITPALSVECAKITEMALKTAKQQGLTTSFDLNYRKKLWTPEKAQEVCIPLMKYVDVCIGNEEDAEKILGLVSEDNDVTRGKLDVENYKPIFRRMKERFDFKKIVTTLRESYSATDNGWSALLYDGINFLSIKKI